jgi:signal peptidase I
MAPTLEAGDRFLVNKLGKPRRLDLIAYWKYGQDPAIYCKRLIGLPGETLRFENGGIYVNDRAITLPPVIAGRCHAATWRGSGQPPLYEDGKSIALAKDEFFVIGDNLDVSLDSRSRGPSRTSSIVGVVDMLYWPLKKVRILR